MLSPVFRHSVSSRTSAELHIHFVAGYHRLFKTIPDRPPLHGRPRSPRAALLCSEFCSCSWSYPVIAHGYCSHNSPRVTTARVAAHVHALAAGTATDGTETRRYVSPMLPFLTLKEKCSFFMYERQKTAVNSRVELPRSGVFFPPQGKSLGRLAWLTPTHGVVTLGVAEATTGVDLALRAIDSWSEAKEIA